MIPRGSTPHRAFALPSPDSSGSTRSVRSPRSLEGLVFGIGMPEILVILVVALLVLGPRKLPEIARSLGRGMAEFRRASNEFTRTPERPHSVAKVCVRRCTAALAGA